jgi:hypothetical protein
MPSTWPCAPAESDPSGASNIENLMRGEPALSTRMGSRIGSDRELAELGCGQTMGMGIGAATAQLAIRVRTLSARLVRMTGTRAPSTTPAPSTLARNVIEHGVIVVLAALEAHRCSEHVQAAFGLFDFVNPPVCDLARLTGITRAGPIGAVEDRNALHLIAVILRIGPSDANADLRLPVIQGIGQRQIVRVASIVKCCRIFGVAGADHYRHRMAPVDSVRQRPPIRLAKPRNRGFRLTGQVQPQTPAACRWADDRTGLPTPGRPIGITAARRLDRGIKS